MIKRIHIAWLVLVVMTGFSPRVTAPQEMFHPVGRRPHTVTLRFRHRVGDRTLTLFTDTYLDPYGEPFTIEKFKYYITDLRVTGDDNTQQVVNEDSHLVDEADSATKSITFSTTISHIGSIQFMIGVDSIKNVSGAQEGDLDPLKGMFWTWNSGYVFAKLEGKSDSSHANAHFLSWHIGGFRQDQNAARLVKLAIGGQSGAMAPDAQTGAAAASIANDTITVNVDILKWFDAVHPIRIIQSPVCHDPGPLAMQIADNYASMFSIGQ